MADFSGVCSGDIYVLEPKGNALLPALLPFFCQTDAFFDHAVGTSAGSLSPRTNWDSLASFEFTLPPLEEQRRILCVLQQAERLNTARRDATEKSSVLFRSMLSYLTLGRHVTGPRRMTALGTIPGHWRVQPLGDVASFANGVAKPASAFGSGTPFVNLQDVFGQVVLRSVPKELVQVSDAEIESLSLRHHDILFVRSSVKPEGVAHPVLIEGDWNRVVFAGFLIRCRIEEPVLDPRFANLLFREGNFRRLVQSRSTVSLNTNINQGQLGLLPVVIPPLDQQRQIVSCLYPVLRGIAELERRLQQDRSLRQELIGSCLERVGSDR